MRFPARYETLPQDPYPPNLTEASARVVPKARASGVTGLTGAGRGLWLASQTNGKRSPWPPKDKYAGSASDAALGLSN